MAGGDNFNFFAAATNVSGKSTRGVSRHLYFDFLKMHLLILNLHPKSGVKYFGKVS
jgi:hypothetical protein